MILLAEHAVGQKQGGQPLIGGLDVTVNRNYFGRQNQSFEVLLDAPVLGEEPFRAVFIRAPAILTAGARVDVLAEAPGHGEQVIVAVRQGPILATAFHPELTDDLRWHRLFLAMVEERRSGQHGTPAA
jgi:5'-phosphate synthase pdxT subunit